MEHPGISGVPGHPQWSAKWLVNPLWQAGFVMKHPLAGARTTYRGEPYSEVDRGVDEEPTPPRAGYRGVRIAALSRILRKTEETARDTNSLLG